MSPSHLTALDLVGYGRCSSNGQERSVPEQIEWINGQIERGQHTLVAPVFTDEAIPGHDLVGREGFQAMLAFCERRHKEGKPVNGVIIFLLSRFSRAEPWWTEESWNRLRRAGVRWLITSTRTYDLNSRTDHLILTIEQGNEASFSPTLAKNVTRGLASRAKAGHPVSAQPYGYRTVYRATGKGGKQEPDHWEIDPDAAAVVRRIFRLYASGSHSLRSIADLLNREGSASPAAARGRKRQGKGWSTTTVRRTLKNDVYLGIHVWNRRRAGVFACTVDGIPAERPEEEKGRLMDNDPAQVIRRENAHEAIIDRETFDRVQDILEQNDEHPTPCRSKRTYLFSGLLRCAACGRTMAGRASRGLPPSYWCSTYNNKGRGSCQPNRISEARFLAALAAKLKERFNPAFLADFAEAVRREAESDKASRGAEAADLRARLADLDEQMRQHGERLLRVAESLLPIVEAAALATKQQRDAVALELLKVEAQPKENKLDVDTMIESARARLDTLETVLATGEPADVRAFFRDNIEHIDVHFLPTSKDRSERFLRALVYVREDSPLVYLLYTDHLSVPNKKSYATG